MPKLLNYQRFCEDLKEVTSLKIFYKKRFHPEGLFSEQIFGPLKNFTCQCGIYFGISKSGGTCDQCKVDIVNSNVRRVRFAKISLPIPVVNPLFYDLLIELGGKTLKSGLDKLMKNEKSFLFMDGENYNISVDQELITPDLVIFERVEAIYKMIEALAKTMTKEGRKDWKIIHDNIDSLLIRDIIVLPPDLRPTSAMSTGKQLMDKINSVYVQILTKKEMMKNTVVDLLRDKNLYYTYFKQIQKDVNDLYTQILEKMAKKEGLIRGNILGKRTDFSGRAVITPDPTIQLTECILPYKIILELYKISIAKRIIEVGKFKLLNKALDFVDECIELDSPALYKICEEIIEDEVCILNRQPSLHRLGMLGFNIKMTLDKVIKIHPLVCPPFNADFDGDQMAIYIPISNETKAEIRNKMLITKNFYSPANEELTTSPSQDIILGIYFLTSDRSNEEDGFKIFNDCLPDDYPEITKTVNKKVLMRILNDIKERYPEDIMINVLDNIKRIGFKYATITGCTLSLDDFSFDEARELCASLYRDNDTRHQLAAVNRKEVLDILKEKFKYSYMIDSGARGSWDQAKQIVLTRGFVANFDGDILPLPIKNSLVEGLTQEEFFYSTYGCRKGLLDIALNTGTSGYLSRKLIFTCANLQLDYNNEDCGTEDLLEVSVKNERKANMLVNRFYLNENKELELITKENCLSLVDKIIFIRSPIFCKSPGICQTCYGNLYKKINTRFIGIIAAQTLGERTTQLVLRTFHTSGAVHIHGEVNEEELDKEIIHKDIIGDLASASKALHKFKDKNYIDIVDQLFDIYDKNIYHIHFECVVSQLMWHNEKKWRLLPDREKITPQYFSIQNVPTKESWLLAMAFSNPKKSIIHGIINQGQYSGMLDRILKGERIS